MVRYSMMVTMMMRLEKLGEHTPARPLKGGKYSLFEAGTRVAFRNVLERKQSSQEFSDAMVTQIDLLFL